MFEVTGWSHHNPVRVVCAPLDALAQHVHGQHVLLVTSPGFVHRGVAERVAKILAPRQMTAWAGVKPNPDLQDLDAAGTKLRLEGIDCVVGLGGGIALDAAKVLATTLSSPPEPSLAHVFRRKEATYWTPRLPLVVVPTTSGTGAEVTPFATVWDHAEHKKYSLTGDFVYPDVALLDASMTLTLGEEDTLYPALDAISHALESLWNKNCTPISRAFAFQALSLSSEALPQVLTAPQNLKLRQCLQTASVLAGLAISQTRTAIAHSISYPLTSCLGVPHGLACSFTLPQLLAWNMSEMVSDGLDKVLLSSILVMLQKLRLDQRMARFASPTQVQAHRHGMVVVGRSENYRYTLPGDLQDLIALALSGKGER